MHWADVCASSGKSREGVGTGKDAGFDTDPEQWQKQNRTTDFAEWSYVMLNIDFHCFILLLISLLAVLPKSQFSLHKAEAAEHSLQRMISNKGKAG